MSVPKHFCTLPFNARTENVGHSSGRSNVRYPTSRWQRFKKYVRRITVADEDHPKSRMYYGGPTAIRAQQQLHAESRNWFVIHPFSKFRTFWEPLMSLVYAIGLIYIPISVSATYNDINQRKHVLDSFGLLITLFKFVCVFDIAINFLTGIQNKQEKQVILDRDKIVKKYVKGHLCTDLIASIPNHLVLFLIYGNDLTVIPGRPLVAFDILSQTIIFRMRTAYRYSKNTLGIGSVFHLDTTGLVQLILIVVGLGIIVNWFAQYFVIMHEFWDHWLGVPNPHGWVERMYVLMSEGKVQTTPWLLLFLRSANKVLGVDQISYLYENSVYGYIIGSSVLILGAFILQMMNVAGFEIYSRDESAVKCGEMIVQLKEYMRYQKFPEELRNKVLEYYEYKFKGRYFDEENLKSILSEPLQKEILKDALRNLVEKVDFLQLLSEDVLEEVLFSLKMEIYLPGDVIFKAGTLANCVYFLDSGTVAFYTGNGREISHAVDGSYFGEVSLLLMRDLKRCTSAVAVETCEVYRWDKKKFRKCMVNCGEALLLLKETAVKRLDLIMIEEEVQRRHMDD